MKGVVYMQKNFDGVELQVVNVQMRLLPCPFCGSVAKIVVLGQAESNRRRCRTNSRIKNRETVMIRIDRAVFYIL